MDEFTLRTCRAAAALAIWVAAAAAMAIEPETSKPAATDAAESLRYPGKQMRDALVRSAEQLEASIQVDSDEAANYVGLADVQSFLWCYGFAPHAELVALNRAWGL